MVDLNRLKISDSNHRNMTISKGILILMSILLVISFFIGRYINIKFPWEKKIVVVETMIARNSMPSSVAAFTAGGWIEVAAPKYPQKIVARIPGEKIEKIHVKEGDIIKPGQVVAELFPGNKKIAVAATKAELVSQKANLKKLKNGYRVEEIKIAKHTVGDLQEQLILAEINNKRNEDLGPNLISQSEIDKTRAELLILKNRLAKEQANLQMLTSGYRVEEIMQAEANVKKAQAHYDLAKLELSYCYMSSPKNLPALRVLKVYAAEGQVTSAENQMSLIMKLYDPKDIQVRADIRQQNIKQVKIGGPVIVKTDTDIQHTYNGTILRIDPEADIAKNTVSVKIKINNPDQFLFPEMIAQISFLVPESVNVNEDDEDEDDEEEEENTTFMLLPATAIYQEEDESSYVWINDNGFAKKNKITIAKTLENKVEVGSGLKPGTRVIISDASKLQNGIEITEEK